MRATRGNQAFILSADYEETEWGVWGDRTERIYLDYGADDPRNEWATCETYSVNDCGDGECSTFIPDPDNDNIAYPCSYNEDGWTLTADMTKPYQVEWGVYDLEEGQDA